MDFGAGNRFVVRIDLGDCDAFDAFFALNVDDGMREVEGDAVIVEALDDVALETAGIGHELGDAEDFRAFERHAARHDEADVAAAQNDDALAGHIAVNIDEALRGAGREDACRAVAGDIERAARAFAAAHREDDGLGFDAEHAVRAVHRGHGLVRRDVHDHRVELVLDIALENFVDKARGIFRAGQLFFKGVQAETVVDALIEDAAELSVALEDEDALAAGISGGRSCGKSGRTAADDDDIV